MPLAVHELCWTTATSLVTIFANAKWSKAFPCGVPWVLVPDGNVASELLIILGIVLLWSWNQLSVLGFVEQVIAPSRVTDLRVRSVQGVAGFRNGSSNPRVDSCKTNLSEES